MSMNSSVNGLSETCQSPGENQPETSNVPSMSQDTPTKDSPNPTDDQTTSPSSTPVPEPETQVADDHATRKFPIPLPSDPKQYRAIGLILGQYKPSEEQLTRGTLITKDGTELEAVLLGRLISLVKNHLDLTQDHLWVVYPRTRQEDNLLHIQLVGVWAPEILAQESQEEETSAGKDGEESTDTGESPPAEKPIIKDGYFSIRGEVVFYGQEDEKVIVRIRQAPRPGDDRPRMFKLELKGTLPKEKPLFHFWDLHVQLQQNTLAIEEAKDIGILPVKKNKGGKPRRLGGGGGKPRGRFQGKRRPVGSARPFKKGSKPIKPSRPSSASARPTKLGKPIINKKRSASGETSPKPHQDHE